MLVEVLEEALLDAMVLARDKSEIIQIAVLQSVRNCSDFPKTAITGFSGTRRS